MGIWRPSNFLPVLHLIPRFRTQKTSTSPAVALEGLPADLERSRQAPLGFPRARRRGTVWCRCESCLSKIDQFDRGLTFPRSFCAVNSKVEQLFAVRSVPGRSGERLGPVFPAACVSYRKVFPASTPLFLASRRVSEGAERSIARPPLGSLPAGGTSFPGLAGARSLRLTYSSRKVTGGQQLIFRNFRRPQT